MEIKLYLRWGGGLMIKFLIGVLVGLVIAFGVVAVAVYVAPEFASTDVTRVTKSKRAGARAI